MYPKIRLKHKYRVIIFISFVIAFFVVSPLIIFYTAGYRYDWQQNKIKKTGIISVDVTPQTAQVYLNNVKIDKSLPLRLDNRSPGIYNIKIKKEGYKTWEKDIKVESTKTTYIKNINLIKKNLPIKISGDELNYENLKKIKFSPQGRYAMTLTQNDNIFEVNLINLNQMTIDTIARLKLKKEPKFNWSSEGPFGYILTKKENYKIKVFNARTNEIVINTTSKSKLKDKNIRLIGGAIAPELFLKIDQKIKKVTPNEKQGINTVPTSTTAWFINNTGSLNYYDHKNKELHNKSSNKKWRIKENLKSIEEINENIIIATTADHTYVYKLSDGKIESKNKISANSITKLNNPTRWISWNSWQFWEIKKNGDINLINRTGKNINTIQQLNNKNVLLLKTEDGLKTFNTHYYAKQDLFSNGKIKKLKAKEDKKLIYLWGQIGNQKGLFELEY